MIKQSKVFEFAPPWVACARSVTTLTPAHLSLYCDANQAKLCKALLALPVALWFTSANGRCWRETGKWEDGLPSCHLSPRFLSDCPHQVSSFHGHFSFLQLQTSPRPESELSAAAQGCLSSAHGAVFIQAQGNRHQPNSGPSEMSAFCSTAPHLVPLGPAGELFPPCCFHNNIQFASSGFQYLANDIFITFSLLK